MGTPSGAAGPGDVVPSADKQQPLTEKSAVQTGDAGSASSSHGGGAGDVDDFDQALCLKIDLWLLAPLLFLNFFSLMGRANIGAALIQKLPADLHLDATAVFLATSIPAVGIMVFEIPSNLLMRWLERRAGLGFVRYLSLLNLGLGM